MTESVSHQRLRDRLVALTRDLILLPSTESNPTAIRQCYEFVRNHLEGFEGVEIHDHENEGVPSLVALPTGNTAPDVLMVAHLDVVDHPDPAAYRSTIADGRIVGSGAGDMKGALAILMVLFRRFHRANPGISLGLVVTTDEETGGAHGVRYLIDEVGLRCGCALIPDGGSPDEITIEEKGILHLQLIAPGLPAHAARPWLGDNPIPHLTAALDRLANAFDELKSESDDYWHPTCTVTGIGTENGAFNRLAAEAHATLDIRFPPPHTSAELIALVRDVAGDRIQANTIIAAEATHLSPDPKFADITETITGRQPRLSRESGGSDARFLHPHGIPVLMSRPAVGNLHAPDEWIDIESMVEYYRVCEAYLAQRFEVNRPPEP